MEMINVPSPWWGVFFFLLMVVTIVKIYFLTKQREVAQWDDHCSKMPGSAGRLHSLRPRLKVAGGTDFEPAR